MTDKTITDPQDYQSFADIVSEDEADNDASAAGQEAKADDAPENEQGTDPEDTADDQADEAADDDEGESDDAEADDEVKYVTVTDDDGNEWEVPEALSAGFMKSKDYTQKTQHVAEMRRAAEERERQIEALAKRNDEDLKIEAELSRLEAINERYNNLNWSQLAQDDFYDAQQKQFDRQLVRERIEELKGAKNARHEQRLQEMQQETAKRIDEAEAYARANIPGWESGKDREILDFAREIGFDDEALRKNMNGAFIRMLHKAHVGETAMKRATEKPRPAQKQVKPAAKVGAKSNGTKRIRLADADMASFIAAREKGVGPSMNDL